MRNGLLSWLVLIALSAGGGAAPPTGLGPIMGITAVERTDSVEANGQRTVVVYIFLYNDGPQPWKVSAGNYRLLDDEGRPCQLWNRGGPGQLTVPPGGVAFVSPSYTYKGGRDLALTLTYKLNKKKTFQLAVTPRTTSQGDYSVLPPILRSSIEEALKANPAIRWWGH